MNPVRSARWPWAGGIALVVVSLLALSAWSEAASAGRRMGFGVDEHPAGILVTEVDAGFAAERAGLEAGDVIVRVDGLPATKVADWDVAAAHFSPEREVEIEVLRDGERRVLRAHPGAPFPWLRFLLTVITALAYLGLALLIVLQDRRELAPRLLLYFSLAVAVEMSVPAGAVGDLTLGAASLTLFYLLTGVEIGLELHLASVIPERRFWLSRQRWVVPLYYGVGLGLGTATAVTYLVEDVAGHPLFPWSSTQLEEVLLYLALPVWAVAVVALLAVPAFSHPDRRKRQQAALVLAGVTPWAIFVLVTTLADAISLVQLYWLATIEPLVLLAYPVAVFVAIFRYDLFDVEVAVRRSLLYGALTGSLILVFYAALGAGGAVFSELVEERGSVWAIALATLILGLATAPLLRFLQRQIDRRLFPERHAMRQHLIALAGELPAHGKRPLMGEHLADRIAAIFGARSLVLFLADPAIAALGLLVARGTDGDGRLDRSLLLPLDDPALAALQRIGRPVPPAAVRPAEADSPLLARLAALRPELLVPLVSHHRLVGLLVLGPRPGRQPYRGEEMELLGLLSHNVAQVFENARLFESATYESLTGLLRREAILERLEIELHRAIRHHRPLTVGLADLDHFKAVNDRFGHLAGDSLLKRIAEALASSLRDTDAVGRYGGEEFLLVLPETTLPGAQVAAEKMRRAVEAVRLTMDDGSEVSVTVSIGLAEIGLLRDPAGEPTAREMIAAADAALYRAKHAGRNRVHPLLTAAG
ncbi:MAG TPA: diguanylate cyclase [Thermoanaerobaculia bacterium]